MPTEKELLALCLRWILDPQGNDFDRAMLVAAIKAKLEPQRQWVGLTDADIEEIWADGSLGRYATSYAIEAKLREKNA